MENSMVKNIESTITTMEKFNELYNDIEKFRGQNNQNNMNMNELIDAAKEVCNSNVEDIGMLIRNCGEKWKESLLLACAFNLALDTTVVDPYHLKTCDTNKLFCDQVFTISNTVSPINSTEYQPVQTIQNFIAIESAILSLEIDETYLLKPLMDGKELIEKLELSKSKMGPLIGKLMEEQIRWQIKTKSTNLQELILHLKQKQIL